MPPARVSSFQELIELTRDENSTAPRLCVSLEFVRSWRERERTLSDGRIVRELGPEPSHGFIARALAELRP